MFDMGIPDLPNGVNETRGMCNERNSYQKYKAPAYAINKGAMITVATSEVSCLIKYSATNMNLNLNSSLRYLMMDSQLTSQSSLSLSPSKYSLVSLCFLFTILKAKNLWFCSSDQKSLLFTKIQKEI